MPVTSFTLSGEDGSPASYIGNIMLLLTLFTTIYGFGLRGGPSVSSQSVSDVNGITNGQRRLVAAPTATMIDKLVAGGATAFDYSGVSVSIPGDILVVGSQRDTDGDIDSRSAAYVFELSEATWTQSDKLVADNAAGNGYFGESVTISGVIEVVGSWQDDDSFTDSGSVFVFEKSGTMWTQTAKLAAQDAKKHDRFGYSISISGDMVVVGSWYDDTEQGKAGANVDAGSVYVSKKIKTFE